MDNYTDQQRQALMDNLGQALDALRYRALRSFMCAGPEVQAQLGNVMQAVIGTQDLTPAMVDRMMDEAVARVRIVKA